MREAMTSRPSLALAALLVTALALSCGPAIAAEPDPFGRWLAEDIDGGGVIDRLQTTVEIKSSGEVFGFGGCNLFRGKAEISDRAIKFGPLAATRKMCTPAVSNQEMKFFKALDVVRLFDSDSLRRKLSLRDGDGREVLRLALID
jgi:heat shock protein HslJ